MLLKISRLSRSTYFYSLKKMNYKEEKDKVLGDLIERIYNENHQKYGYIRITQELKNRGYSVNKKRVARNLSAITKTRQYHSYKGQIGKIVPNILERDFTTTGPYQKLGTDITQFITQYGKLYLSPIIDFHTREILAYDISTHPNFEQIKRMLKMLKDNHGNKIKGAILHSDQGYQYQMKGYQKALKDLGIKQSMSRKGNCLDNSPTENFFGRLKTEIYYDKEYTYKSLEELKCNIENYIEYYNNKRIVIKLGMAPIVYRQLVENNL